MPRNDFINVDGTINYDNIASAQDLNFKNNYINIKNFGAIGNALYYDNVNMQWWTDSTKTTRPHDDSANIQRAIDYAVNNNIDTLYFPDGAYYTFNKTFTIDSSKMRFVGENDTQLISTGLTGTAVFITITSPGQLAMYDYPRTPIRNISIKGNYFENNPYSVKQIKGLSIDVAGVHCHSAIYDIVIIGFNYGFKIVNGYKSSAFNLSIIACDTGIWCGSGSIIPYHIYNLYIECCAVAIYNLGGGFCTLFITGGAIEYNRQIYTGLSKVVFNSIRFEGDLRACCDNNLNMFYPFQVSDDFNSEIVFDNCQFLWLNNYSGNVTYWIPNIITSTLMPDYMMFAYAPSFTGTSLVTLANCNYASEQIFTTKKLVQSSGNVACVNFNANQSNFIFTENNNLIYNSSSILPDCFSSGTTIVTVGAGYGYSILAGGKITLSYNNLNRYFALLGTYTSGSNITINLKRGTVSTLLKTGVVTATNNVVIQANLSPMYDTVEIVFASATTISLPTANII